MPPVGGSAAYRQRKPNNLASLVEMHPFCLRHLSTGKRLTRFSLACGSLRIVFACHPGGGGLLSASLSANLSRSLHSGARSSPFGGKVVRQHQKGCISLAPKARLACFPTGESPVVWFYHTGALLRCKMHPLCRLKTTSLHGKASHTILSRLRLPTNRVRLPPHL